MGPSLILIAKHQVKAHMGTREFKALPFRLYVASDKLSLQATGPDGAIAAIFFPIHQMGQSRNTNVGGRCVKVEQKEKEKIDKKIAR